jgi:hypothetical protein
VASNVCGQCSILWSVRKNEKVQKLIIWHYYLIIGHCKLMLGKNNNLDKKTNVASNVHGQCSILWSVWF